ncbi:unnamed protein product [Ostreobium quekettii]|uniref:DUF1565 domain-containing protein n=1 Tax=Ostreobium quekettii TaxID=121088 RepID=A0A8S1JH55_9CHLO|nr:unnamed protein product [Ostreobium quekettii]
MIDMAPFMIPDVPDEPECDMNAIDLPDRYGFDTNCDGIDGDIAQSVFVASYGDDSFDGSRFEPKRTIQAALDQASMDPTKTWVLVQEGLYDGPLTLVDGVSIAGGYELGWARDGDGFSTLTGGNSVLKGTPTIRGTGIITPTYLMNLEVRPEEQIPPGESVYTVALLDSPAVILERMFILGGTAGNGLDGAPGEPGDNGPRGGKGGDGKEDGGGSAGVQIRSTRIVIGQGGNGGRGGNGGPGGDGGPGGKGGKRDDDDGLGGDGGDGGKGGLGGTGGGGAGGPAYGIYSDATMLVPPAEMTYIQGQGGFGGAGSGPMGQGAPGASADMQVGEGAQ